MGRKEKKKGKKKGKNGKRNTTKPKRELIPSDILSRSSLEEILRFKLVCRQWGETLSSSHFTIAHFRRSSSLQQRGLSIVFHTYSADDGNVILHYKENKLIELLKNPFPREFSDISILGPLNGLLLVFELNKLYSTIIVWNPVMKKSECCKFLRPLRKVEEPSLVSIGFGFDVQKYSFYILRVLVYGGKATKFDVRYLNSSFGRKKRKCNITFCIDRYCCDVVIQGEPYWLGYNLEHHIPHQYDCVVHYNPSKMAFEVFDLPFVDFDFKRIFTAGASELREKLVEMNDALGFLTWKESENTLQIWRRINNGWELKETTQFLGMERIFGCLRNGSILAGEKGENKKQLIRIYGENPKEFYIEGKLLNMFDFLGSLVVTKAMEPVKDQYDIRDFVS